MRRRYLKYINPWVQSLIRLVTVLEKKRKEIILTLLTLNHGNQPPNKFLIALPFPCILIIHSLPCICSWLWIFLFQQHLVRFQEAHLNDCIFFFFPLQWFVIHLHVGVSQWPLLPLLCWSFKCLVSQHVSSTFRAIYIFLLSWAASCWSRGFQLVTPRPRSPPRPSVNNFLRSYFDIFKCKKKKKKNATQKRVFDCFYAISDEPRLLFTAYIACCEEYNSAYFSPLSCSVRSPAPSKFHQISRWQMFLSIWRHNPSPHSLACYFS